jgi:hypothetical protein
MTIFRRICVQPFARDAVQQEPVDVDSPVPDVPGVVPVVGHGTVTEVPIVESVVDGVGVTSTAGGLRPPAPSSVEPIGTPSRLTDDPEPIPVGDEADIAGPAKELPPIAAQAPDVVPVMPPPSKVEVELDVPGDVPVIELPMPDVMPTLELPIPKDVCGIEPPMPAHCAMAPVPDAVGLTPGAASSVAPRGVPAGATGEPGPMPSGDVMPSGEAPGEVLMPPTCAKAEPQPKKTAAVAAVTKRSVIG